MTSTIALSAFGDEIALNFRTQLEVLRELDIPFIDIRRAWDVYVNNFTDEHVSEVNALLTEYNIRVACIGSPIGKSPLEDPLQTELDKLKRVASIAHQVGTRRVRIFSFYPQQAVDKAVLAEAIERLHKLVEEAERQDVTLLLENEKHLVGDTPQRVHAILSTIDNPTLRFLWDPANFVQCGIENQVYQYWETLGQFVAYVHIKDAHLADGSICPAGHGDGQIDVLLEKLFSAGYNGILSLEPHLQAAMKGGGFSGPEMMALAVSELRNVIAKVEQHINE